MILDCEWGKWEDWLKCTASCGGGVQVRTRRTIPYNEPWECIGSFIDQQSCNIKPCPEVETLQKDVIYLQRESMFKPLFIIVFQSQITNMIFITYLEYVFLQGEIFSSLKEFISIITIFQIMDLQQECHQLT